MTIATASPATVLLWIYVAGVAVGLAAIDARPLARLGLALLWPLGPIAFVVTIAILLLALPIAFPLVGSLVLAAVAAAIGAAVLFAEPAAAVPADARPALGARFIGNMAFAITDGKTTLVTDFPCESGCSVYTEYDAREIRSGTPRSLALITRRRTRNAGRRIDARRVVIYPHTGEEAVPDCTGACSVPRQGETLRF